VRHHLSIRLGSHLDWHYRDENSLSQYFVARRTRDNGRPAKMLKQYVVRLYKKITLSGFDLVRMAAR